jgi:hypothetical protein
VLFEAAKNYLLTTFGALAKLSLKRSEDLAWSCLTQFKSGPRMDVMRVEIEGSI